MLTDLVVTVGVTPTLLVNPGTDINPNEIRWAEISNPSGVTLYLGGPNVSTTTGRPVIAGGSWSATLGNTDSVYGVVAAATQNINVLKSRPTILP